MTKQKRIARDRIIAHVIWWWDNGNEGAGPIPFGSLIDGYSEDENYDTSRGGDEVEFGDVVREYVNIR